jgi:hypothetical protein
MTTFPRSVCMMVAFVAVEAATAATANIMVLKPETCGNSNGEMYAYMSGSGSVAPYSYLWSNGATTGTITGLPGGSYSVTITDAIGTPYTANSTVESFPALPFDGSTQYGPSALSFFDITGFAGMPCPGECNGIFSLPQVSLGGTPPFSASFDVAVTPLGVDNYGFLYFSGFCDGATVNYTITDAQGCQGSSYFTVNPVQLDALPSASDMQGACAGSDIGSFNLNPAGTPTLYSISNGGDHIVQDTVLMSSMFTRTAPSQRASTPWMPTPCWASAQRPPRSKYRISDPVARRCKVRRGSIKMRIVYSMQARWACPAA